MSQTQTANGAGGEDAPLPIHEDVDRVARANGWRPREQFKGDPEKWVPADVFVARGLENPDMLRANNSILVQKMDRMERQNATVVNGLKAQLDETLGTVATMTTMMRTSEQRAYERARRELKAEQAKAVETGDTATFQRLDTEIEQLEKTKPAEPPPKPAQTQPVPGTPPPVPPEAQAFFQRNPWYHQNPDLMKEADIIHMGLLAARKDLSLEDNLAEVERRIKAQFPERTGGTRAAPTAAANGHDDQGGEDRQNGPQAVMPSSGGAPRRAAGRFTFDSMPKDSKDAYTKYADQLKRADENAGRKHEPLSKDEWARTYWSQFRDDGA
jgi:hypothetical protein